MQGQSKALPALRNLENIDSSGAPSIISPDGTTDQIIILSTMTLAPINAHYNTLSTITFCI